MSSPASDIAEFLQVSNIGQLAQNLFVGVEPPQPQFVTTVYDTGGGGTRLHIEGGTPTIQIRTRSSSYDEGYTMQERIKNLLEFYGFTSETHFYSMVQLTSDIFMIGKDENNLFVFTSNYQIERQVKTL